VLGKDRSASDVGDDGGIPVSCERQVRDFLIKRRSRKRRERDRGKRGGTEREEE
jgi:hypothetical protein